jgi:hypothetical protein
VVQQEEVDVVDAEPPQAAVEADECLVVAVVADPELGDMKIWLRSIAARRIPSPTSRSLP